MTVRGRDRLAGLLLDTALVAVILVGVPLAALAYHAARLCGHRAGSRGRTGCNPSGGSHARVLQVDAAGPGRLAGHGLGDRHGAGGVTVAEPDAQTLPRWLTAELVADQLAIVHDKARRLADQASEASEYASAADLLGVALRAAEALGRLLEAEGQRDPEGQGPPGHPLQP